MNVNVLSTDAPFKVFENFGFRSGRAMDKFEGWEKYTSDNGLIFLQRYINSFMSLKVKSYVDVGTHGMFICEVTEARVINSNPTMTYTLIIKKTLNRSRKPKERKVTYVKYADTCTNEKNYPKTTYVRCVNTERRILSR